MTCMTETWIFKALNEDFFKDVTDNDVQEEIAETDDVFKTHIQFNVIFNTVCGKTYTSIYELCYKLNFIMRESGLFQNTKVCFASIYNRNYNGKESYTEFTDLNKLPKDKEWKRFLADPEQIYNEYNVEVKIGIVPETDIDYKRYSLYVYRMIRELQHKILKLCQDNLLITIDDPIFGDEREYDICRDLTEFWYMKFYKFLTGKDINVNHPDYKRNNSVVRSLINIDEIVKEGIEKINTQEYIRKDNKFFGKWADFDFKITDYKVTKEENKNLEYNYIIEIVIDTQGNKVELQNIILLLKMHILDVIPRPFIKYNAVAFLINQSKCNAEIIGLDRKTIDPCFDNREKRDYTCNAKVEALEYVKQINGKNIGGGNPKEVKNTRITVI